MVMSDEEFTYSARQIYAIDTDSLTTGNMIDISWGNARHYEEKLYNPPVPTKIKWL